MDAQVVVIGAGVVGLAVAERLSRSTRSVVVVERHDGFGRETSSRNSEVIHSGMYYAETLLKTTLCVRGNPLLYETCLRAGVPHRRTGKIVVAADESEEGALLSILAQGTKNGVPGLRLVDSRELAAVEPDVRGTRGLLSPESGVVDSHGLMSFLHEQARSRGVTFGFHCAVSSVVRSAAGYQVDMTDADGAPLTIRSECVVNSAGLGADRIAQSAGIDIDGAGYRIHPAKGEYFRISSRHRGRLARLVYPVPTEVHLGAHAVLGLDGGLKVGPNAIPGTLDDYSVDPSHEPDFFRKASRFLPFLEPGDLTPDMAGLRPKLAPLDQPMKDFVIREESDRGLPGLVDLVGMESPALTSCLAIAEMVERLLGLSPAVQSP